MKNFALLRGPVGGSFAVPILDWHFLRYLFISAKTGTAHIFLKDWVDGISIFMIFTLWLAAGAWQTKIYVQPNMILLPITSESHDTCHSFGSETSRPINKKFFFSLLRRGFYFSFVSRERESSSIALAHAPRPSGIYLHFRVKKKKGNEDKYK